jgi:hypothetical protein
MGKRGEVKRTSAKRQRSAGVKSASVQVVRDAGREVRSAQSILSREESRMDKNIEKEAKFLLGPSEFHVVTFVSSLIILAFLLNSKSLIFYSIMTIAVLVFAHFMKQHHRPHDEITIAGIFFLPLAVTLSVFRDTLAWLLLALYLLSLVSAVIIYYYQKRQHTLLKVMWQVTYSKVVSVTLAIIVACMMPFIFPDAFLSVFELLFIYVLPVAFVFFFSSKFLYLYFFDRKHIKMDLARSLKHTMIYSISIVILCMCIYSLFAVYLYNSRSATYESGLDNVLTGVGAVQQVMEKQPVALKSLPVSDDIASFASEIGSDASAKKSGLISRQLSFADIADDSYLGWLAEDSYSMVRLVVLESELVVIKAAVADAFFSMDAYSLPEDNKTRVAYLSGLESDVRGRLVYNMDDPDVRELVSALDDESLSVSDFENQGFFYWFTSEEGVNMVYESDSIVGRQFALALKHTVLLRDITRLTLKSIIFVRAESASGSAINALYRNMENDVNPVSSALRLNIIKAYLDSKGTGKAEQV